MQTWIVSICLFFLMGYTSASAHSGAVAQAVPLSGIVVDGDLSDWPETMVRYPIRRTEFYEPPSNADDIQAHFYIGYDMNENALYIAIEVLDDSVVLLDSGGTWRNQDGSGLYLDVVHGDLTSPVLHYGLWGNIHRVAGTPGKEGTCAVKL